MCRALAKGSAGRLLRGRRLPSADDRGGQDARAAPRDPRPRGPDRRPGPCEAGPVRRARAVPRNRRPHPRLRAARRVGSRRGGPAGGGGRHSRSDLAARPRRIRCGHRRGLDPEVRGSPRLRRAPRRVPGHEGRAQANDPGPAGRGVPRRRGPTGLSPRAPDPRAAHPSRQGDEQHLHGAGPARGDGRHVRGLPRAGGPAGHCPARPRSHRAPRAGLAPPRLRHGQRAVLRHAAGTNGPGGGGARDLPSPRAGNQPARYIPTDRLELRSTRR